MGVYFPRLDDSDTHSWGSPTSTQLKRGLVPISGCKNAVDGTQVWMCGGQSQTSKLLQTTPRSICNCRRAKRNQQQQTTACSRAVSSKPHMLKESSPKKSRARRQLRFNRHRGKQRTGIIDYPTRGSLKPRIVKLAP